MFKPKTKKYKRFFGALLGLQAGRREKRARPSLASVRQRQAAAHAAPSACAATDDDDPEERDDRDNRDDRDDRDDRGHRDEREISDWFASSSATLELGVDEFSFLG